MLRSLLNITGDLVRVVTAPVEIAADLAATVTKPVADVAQDIVDDIKEATHDNR